MLVLKSVRHIRGINEALLQVQKSKILCNVGCLLRQKHSECHKPFSDSVDKIKTLQSDDRFVHVIWSSGKQSRFPYMFLRENCKCPSCFHPEVKQRIVFVTKEISVADHIAVQDNGSFLECRWLDGHVSRYDSSWLLYRCLVEETDKNSHENFSVVKDGCKLFSSEYKFSEKAYDYDEVLSDDSSLLHWLYDLHSYGLTMIKNAPKKEGVLFKLAKRLGHHKPTIHGEHYSVKDKGSINLAYTNIVLEPHTDLPQMMSPPDVQALHCIEQETVGGTNSFIDGFRVALALKEKNPKMFDILTSKKIARHDKANSVMGEFVLDQSRPIIQLTDSGQLDKIFCLNFSLADYFEDMTPEEVLDYYNAKAEFMNFFDSREFLIRHKLKPGEIAIFDNNRVLHGRDAFSVKPGGSRWLDGMYFDWDPIVSKIKVLNRRFGYPLPFKYHTPPHYS